MCIFHSAFFIELNIKKSGALLGYLYKKNQLRSIYDDPQIIQDKHTENKVKCSTTSSFSGLVKLKS